MAKPRKKDQTEFERMRDVMKRLVETPPKPHEPTKEKTRKRKRVPAKPTNSRD